ncbi:MAG: tRNA (guanosine(46)-N7)-methyltransferase TrmB [Sulfurospirillaceae bacterium]|nr:tRNA (guanosine(46)-N7)-methyltransferase TrmB [Sulfurospirillaceae bacterium]MCK9545792.1 tRNA (guanosine(46)-N7)-methyltransferase TrmB [Sulfurospirillaceae bacterium]MDY0237618.1 tRNA (guanosine(46)-N7)-methyltransferase TrmB [Campylobacterales bacterium]NLM98961.1 tRNA (guanosine(46)-N7)-methyltransferase TrmB [Campylobacteraceae bacterium]
MPNLHIENLTPFAYPASIGEVGFIWEARNEKETLVLAKNKDEEFFIKIVKKENHFLLKSDKITKPTDANLLKEALNEYKKGVKGIEIFSNTSISKKKSEKNSNLLKKIDFFSKISKEKREIWLEIGFGSGRHLLHQAKENRDVLIIGIEIYKPSIEQVLKRAHLEGVENIYLIDYDARILMEFLNSNSIGKIFVHFPVPWDKKPHRRVISKEFTNEALRVLKKDGFLELRTDSELYFDFALKTFLDFEKTIINIEKNMDLPISSKYEDRWKRLNKDIYNVKIFSKKVDDPIKPPSKLIFSGEFLPINFDLKNRIFKDKDFFLKVEEVYETESEKYLLKVAFGSFDMPEHRYVVIEKNSAYYFPHQVYSTRANKEAHEVLQSWLKDG